MTDTYSPQDPRRAPPPPVPAALPPLPYPPDSAFRRGRGLPELSPEEQRAYDRERACIESEAQLLLDYQARDWLLGYFLLQSLHSGYWQRDPRHPHERFVPWARAYFRIGSDDQVYRLLRLAAGYRYEEYLGLVGKGVCKSVLDTLLRAPAARPQLLKVAEQGANVDGMRRAVARAKALLARPPSAELLQAELLESAAKEMKREAKAAAEERPPPRAAEEEAELARRLREVGERELALRQQEAAQGEARRALEQEATERAQALGRREAMVGVLEALTREARAAGVPVEEWVEQRYQQVAQRGLELLRRERELDERGAAQDARAAELAALAAGLAEQGLGLVALAVELEPRAQAVEAAQGLQRELDAQQRALEDRGAALARTAARLDEEQEELGARMAHWKELWAEVKAREAEVNRLHEAHLRLTLLEKRDGMPPFKNTLDATVLHIYKSCQDLQALADQSQWELLEDGQQTLQPGGFLNSLVVALLVTHTRDKLLRALQRMMLRTLDEDPLQCKVEADRFKRLQETDQLNLLALLGEQPLPEALEPARARPYALPEAVVLGTSNLRTPQRALLGTVEVEGAGSRKELQAVGLCLNRPEVVTLFGVQESGKSNTVRVVVESLTEAIEGVSDLKRGVVLLQLHLGELADPAPELRTVGQPNREAYGVQALAEVGARPQGLRKGRLRVLTDALPEAELRALARQYPPGAQVGPLRVPRRFLTLRDVRLFMSAQDKPEEGAYAQDIDTVLRGHPEASSAQEAWAVLEGAGLRPAVLEFARRRWGLMERFVGGEESPFEGAEAADKFILDLRSNSLTEQEGRAVCAVVLGVFARLSGADGKPLLRMVVIDEAHKVLGKNDFLSQRILGLIKQMRHKRTWVVLATQDPRSLPAAAVDLSSLQISHQLPSSKMQEALVAASAGWSGVVEELATLQLGEAYVLPRRATERAWQVPRRLRIRASVSAPGGSTDTAVPERELLVEEDEEG